MARAYLPPATVRTLQKILSSVEKDKELQDLAAAKDDVLGRFQPLFAPDNISSLSEEDFKSLLLFENNRHWTGLHRRGFAACADMDLLRRALRILVDESKPTSGRLDVLLPKNQAPMVPYLGRAVITAILQVVYPDKYGVWNGTSDTHFT